MSRDIERERLGQDWHQYEEPFEQRLQDSDNCWHNDPPVYIIDSEVVFDHDHVQKRRHDSDHGQKRIHENS